jgi:signal transduction histidine kinase
VDFSQLSVSSASLLGWLAETLQDAPDLRRLRLLPLRCAVGEPALLLHDRELPAEMVHGPGVAALTALWSGALGAATRHDGARRLQEKLADANRRLVSTQEQLTHAESLARLGRLTAGAAHEMNNPLAIIRGRAQVLAQSLPESADEGGAPMSVEAIIEAADRLSELISGLHFFADPPAPNRALVDLTDLLGRVIAQVKRDRAAEGLATVPVKLAVLDRLPPAYVDGSQIGAAVTELLQNAMDAGAEDFIELRAENVPPDDRLCISVVDRGRGMDRQTLARASEPFFSRCQAGRRAGLGLSKALRLAEQHGGRLELESAPSEGTVARIVLARWKREEEAGSRAA